MDKAHNLGVKVYADGADLNSMLELKKLPFVSGFTTNPSLMRKAGISDYPKFAKEVLKHISDQPISFEVFSDDFPEMERQANEIATWGKNVYVKIPVMNTKGKSCGELIRKLSQRGVKINVTAIFTMPQIVDAFDALRGGAPSNISVFAGRMADIGVDPMPYMHTAVSLANTTKDCEVIWASCREVYNVMQAAEIGCHIITAPTDVIKKLSTFGRDLTEVAYEAVKTFEQDSLAAGFKI